MVPSGIPNSLAALAPPFSLASFLLMRMGVDRNREVFDKERNLNYSLKGTYGTSGFMMPDLLSGPGCVRQC